MKTVVISVGGSAIVPDKVDYLFLKKLKTVLLDVKKKKIVICTGGGTTARNYIAPLRKEGLNEYTQDLVGIEATRINAHLVASFLEKANRKIPTTLEEVADMLKVNNIVVCGGLSPGQTSDGTTAMIAEYLNADVLVNLTNVDGLFNKDPKRYKNAKFIPKLSHKEFKIIMDRVKQKPGQHFILDHLAARITRKAEIKVIIMKGVLNLKKFLEGRTFKGTIIH